MVRGRECDVLPPVPANALDELVADQPSFQSVLTYVTLLYNTL